MTITFIYIDQAQCWSVKHRFDCLVDGKEVQYTTVLYLYFSHVMPSLMLLRQHTSGPYIFLWYSMRHEACTFHVCLNTIVTGILITTVQLSLAEILEMNLQYLIFFTSVRNLSHVTLLSASDTSYCRTIPVSVPEVLDLCTTMLLLGAVLSLHAPLASAGKFHSQSIRKKFKTLSFQSIY